MTSEAATSRALLFARVAIVVVVAGGLALAWQRGLFSEVAEPRRFAQAVVAMGVWGYLGFILAYTLLQPFGVPGTVFIVAAPLIWPWPIAFALSMTGTMAASVVGFSFARFVARDWVSARIPARFRKYDEALERHAFRTVFLLRLIFWMPMWLHGLLGISKVRFSTHFWASLLGYLPPLFVVSYFASAMFDDEGRLRIELEAQSVFGVLVAALLAGVLIVGRLRRARQERQAS